MFVLRVQKRVSFHWSTAWKVRADSCSTFCRRPLESPRRASRSIPLQIPEHRLRQPHLSSKHWRVVCLFLTNKAKTNTCRSGSVCLDVINQTWSPMFDMINIFEVFLPQLLRYPNPTDPLNGEAAALLMREPKSYEAKVKGQSLDLSKRGYRANSSRICY